MFENLSFPSAYEAFNYFECPAWVVIALALPFRFRRCPPEKRCIILVASVIFVLFGVSDFLEAPTHARLPAWLWAWKLACATALLGCRFFCLGRARFRWLERTNLVAFACFPAVLLAMFLQYWFRDILAEAP